MKKIFKKAMTVLSGVALIGMTVGVASAAAYPAPFTSNTAIVVGANAAPSDGIAASLIAADLDANAVVTTTAGGTITGESQDLADGSDLLYLNDAFNHNVQTLTKDDLPTVLADGTFTDDEGTDYDFEQTLVLGAGSSFAFSNSDNDLDDPALLLDLSTTETATNAIYDLTATFNTAIPFNATDSEGEELTLFGKTYTVGTATTATSLVLLGGASGSIVNVGESTTMIVNGISYDVTLSGLSSGTDTLASVSVNGDSKTFEQGDTKTIAGVDVYVKTVFRTGDDAGYAEIQLGADKLTFTTASAVQTGSDNDDIEGTLVTIGGTVDAMTSLKITVAAEDNDANHLLVGESFVDPVFGTVLVNFDGVENGPEFTEEQDNSRNLLQVNKDGNLELTLSVTDNAGDSTTLPFDYNGILQDDDSNTISIVEGKSLVDDGYFILNSGNNQHFMQMTKVNVVAATAGAATDDVAMKDLLSGITYTFDNKNFGSDGDGYDATILGQTYTITGNGTANYVSVVSSDYSTKRTIYPYLELVSGEDTRFAMTDEVTIGDTITTVTNNTYVDGKEYELPTGSIEFQINDTLVTGDGVAVVQYRVDQGTWTTISGLVADAAGTETSVQVGSVWYEFGLTITDEASGAAVLTVVDFAIDGGQDVDVNDSVGLPGLLFVEDDDKSESTTTTKNAVIIATQTDSSATYEEINTVDFTGTSDEATWDDSDLVGTLTNYGTYVLEDSTNTDQKLVSIVYGDSIMYAEVSFAEGEVATTTSTTTEAGVMTVMDGAVSSVAGKHLIVVGGSAINSVAASLLGAAYSEAAFTSATGVAAGEFLIQSFARDGKTALLVAGYNAEDTEKAVTYLLHEDVETTTGTKLKGTSATEAVTVTV